MEKKISVIKEIGKPLKVTIVKGSNWNNTKAIDFGGAEVTFNGQVSGGTYPFRDNPTITSLTNATITNDYISTIFTNSAFQVIDNVTFNATNGNFILNDNKSLTRVNIKVDNITTSKSGWFRNDSALTDVVLSAKRLVNANSSNIASDRMFTNCTNLKSLSANFDSLTSISGMFSGLTKLSNVTFANDTLPACTDIQHGFEKTAIETINLNLPVLNGGTIGAFSGCSALTSVTLNMPAQTRFGGDMFKNCVNLKDCRMVVSNNFSGVTSSTNNIFPNCNKLEYLEIVGNGTFTGWTQSTFSIPSAAPCNAYRYLDDLGDGLVKLTFTSQARPEPQPTIGWDVVTDFGTPEYTIELNDSMLRPISDCLHLSSANQTKLDNYLSAKAYDTDKAYIIYADNRLGSRGGSSVAGVTYRITGDNAGAYGTYGIILIHQDGTSAGYYDVYVNDTKVVSRAYGYGRLTVQGYTNNGRSLDLYNTNLEAEVTLPE